MHMSVTFSVGFFQVRAQKKMLQRFEKTNEMLTNVNTLSATRFVAENGHLYKYQPRMFPQAGQSNYRFQETHSNCC